MPFCFNDEVATWENIFLGRTRPFIQKCILSQKNLKEVDKEMVKAKQCKTNFLRDDTITNTILDFHWWKGGPDQHS